MIMDILNDQRRLLPYNNSRTLPRSTVRKAVPPLVSRDEVGRFAGIRRTRPVPAWSWRDGIFLVRCGEEWKEVTWKQFNQLA
jgi:hypothetical protein